MLSSRTNDGIDSKSSRISRRVSPEKSFVRIGNLCKLSVVRLMIRTFYAMKSLHFEKLKGNRDH